MTQTARNMRMNLSRRGRTSLGVLTLAAGLREKVRGEVHFDAGTRVIYAHDSSNYRQIPFGIVIPKDTSDVVAAVEVLTSLSKKTEGRRCILT